VVAFARNPMTLAYTANDLQTLSHGRLILGLGSQIKPHIERRYSMPWSSPVRRMREMVSALHAIWQSWQTGERLSFEGEFYRHTLMTPAFSPPPIPWDRPSVFVAAVGPAMTEMVGEVADGLLVHPFTTADYLREVTLPGLARGLDRAGRERSAMQISHSPMVITGDSAEQRDEMRRSVRSSISFYGSTPAYRDVLGLHGWESLADELHRLSRTPDRDRWDRMRDLVDDEVVAAFAVEAPIAGIASAISQRWSGLVDRVTLPVISGGRWPEVVGALRGDSVATGV